jgi:hypothetical protein
VISCFLHCSNNTTSWADCLLYAYNNILHSSTSPFASIRRKRREEIEDIGGIKIYFEYSSQSRLQLLFIINIWNKTQHTSLSLSQHSIVWAAMANNQPIATTHSFISAAASLYCSSVIQNISP